MFLNLVIFKLIEKVVKFIGIFYGELEIKLKYVNREK